VRELLAQLGPYLEAEVAAFLHDTGVPGVSAAAVIHGERPWAFAYGVADAVRGTPLEPSTPLRVGSLTKPFTAAAILRLRDDGSLGLDDPVVDHLPEFAAVVPFAGARVDEVRVRHLVTHRAGLPGEVHALDEAADAYPTIDGILAGLADLSLRTAPGTATRYSNLGYQLLGEIVARRAGVSFESFCERTMFAPLGLVGTSFDRPPGSAQGHRARAFTDHVTPAADRRKRTNADGGLWSTAPDQAAWIASHLEPGSPFAEMLGPIDGSDGDGGPGQGLGWFRERRDARTLVYHQGSTPGFAARLAFSPALGGGVVVLANGEASAVELLGRVVDLVLDGVEGAVPSEAAPPVPPLPTPLPYPEAWDELLGFYAWPGSAMVFRLEVRAGAMRLVDLHATERPITLEVVGDDVFVAADGGWAGEQVRIRRDDDGRVRGLRLGAWTVSRLIEA
jgi:CubicO group peptidase (beta-lactamase class C family)